MVVRRQGTPERAVYKRVIQHVVEVVGQAYLPSGRRVREGSGGRGEVDGVDEGRGRSGEGQELSHESRRWRELRGVCRWVPRHNLLTLDIAVCRLDDQR